MPASTFRTDNNQDVEEREVLISGSLSGMHLNTRVQKEGGNKRRVFVATIVGLFVATFPVIYINISPGLLANVYPAESDTKSFHFRNNMTPNFICPTAVEEAANFENSTFSEDYLEIVEDIENDFDAFLQTYPNRDFDGWGKSYSQIKKQIYDWKKRRYLPFLKNGDSIYESACGIGMNLLLTLEVATEVKGLKNLKLYGNEYLQQSAENANKILEALAPQNNNAEKGIICAGDSANLQFVPDSSFDLVFTGYIGTLLDPLDLYLDLEEGFQYYYDLCQSDDLVSQKLNARAQQKQDDWFGKWVSEMVRIAKPGAPVIIEQVSVPFCQDPGDWGGVAKNFWKEGARNYGWDIDPTSIEFEKSKVFRYRYNVFMLKNDKTQDK